MMKSLLSDAPDDHASSSNKGLLINFIAMSMLFSINHGCVSSVLAQATASLGNLGSLSTGGLYVCYALTALLIAASLVKRVGSKYSLVLGASMYCIYVGSFFVSIAIPEEMVVERSIVLVVGSVIGGVAAGYLWTAQGKYFVANAKAYSQATGTESKRTTAYFSGIFAGLYLSCELILKLLGTVLEREVLFGVYTATAAAAAFGLFFLKRDFDFTALAHLVKIPESDDKQQDDGANGLDVGVDDAEVDSTLDGDAGQSTKSSSKFLAIKLWCKNPKILLLAPTQMAFGISAALLAYYVSGVVLKNWQYRIALEANSTNYNTTTDDAALVKQAGDAQQMIVSYMSSLTSLVAAAMQIPFSRLEPRVGKAPFMVLSYICFSIMAVFCLVVGETTLGSWYFVVPLFVLQGIGRAGFEGTNKATHADLFPEDSEAAFANIILWNGIGSAFAFFLYPQMFAAYGFEKDALFEKSIDDTPLRYIVSLLSLVMSVTAFIGYACSQIWCLERQRKK